MEKKGVCFNVCFPVDVFPPTAGTRSSNWHSFYKIRSFQLLFILLCLSFCWCYGRFLLWLSFHGSCILKQTAPASRRIRMRSNSEKECKLISKLAGWILKEMFRIKKNAHSSSSQPHSGPWHSSYWHYSIIYTFPTNRMIAVLHVGHWSVKMLIIRKTQRIC